MSSSSVSKIILSGEHVVVYGKPAIALPITSFCSYVSVGKNYNENGIVINAPELNKIFYFDQYKEELNPLELTVKNFLNYYNLPLEQNLTLQINSDIPIASGMGSGASITCSIVKELAKYFKVTITKEELYNQVFEIEKIYHGTPSGVDPKVIVYEKPIYYIKNSTMDFLDFNSNFTLAIIDSEIRSSTKEVVSYVRTQYENDKEKAILLFDKIEQTTEAIKKELLSNKKDFGTLLTENHSYLKELGVSTNILDDIVNKSISAGASGAKLSGAGWGGVVIALLDKDKIPSFRNQMEAYNLNNIMFTDL